MFSLVYASKSSDVNIYKMLTVTSRVIRGHSGREGALGKGGMGKGGALVEEEPRENNTGEGPQKIEW